MSSNGAILHTVSGGANGPCTRCISPGLESIQEHVCVSSSSPDTSSSSETNLVQGRVVLIAPFWLESVWFPMVVSMLYEPPRRLRYREDLVMNTATGHPLPSLNKLRLTAWPLSLQQPGNKASLTTLSRYYANHGSQERSDHVTVPGFHGVNGVQSLDWTTLHSL